MSFLQRNIKRIATDAAGYLLLLAAIATGWLPGPGGIPLAVAGLGLLSIHNAWAKRLRELLLTHGGRVTQLLFPRHHWLEWFYDGLSLLLLAVCLYLGFLHAAIWQVSLSAFCFFMAATIALINRDRLNRLRARQ